MGRRRAHSIRINVLTSVIFATAAVFGPLPTAAARTLSQELRVEAITADGVTLAGTYYSGARRPVVGLLFVHGFTADHRAEPGASLGSAMAARGYSSLALDMRDQGCCVQTTLFEDALADIGAGVEYLERSGATRLVLIGHSLGANRVAYYQAQSQRPSVEAIVLLASAGNTHDRARELSPALAARIIAEAQRRDAEGSQELLLAALGPFGIHLFTAASLLSYGGPETRSDHLQWVSEIRVPLLLVHGAADALTPVEQSELGAAAASAAPLKQLAILDEADHFFSGHGHELANLIDDWLASTLSDSRAVS